MLVTGVLFGRPDLVVLATPLAIVSIWSTLTRPTREPVVDCPVTALTVHEGEEFTWAARFSVVPGMRRVVAIYRPQQWLDVEPEDGLILEANPTAATEATIAMRTTRWGRRTLDDPAVAAYSAWNAWRWGPVTLPGLRLTALPISVPNDSAAPAPHPRGLVGMERAPRPGEGTEFAKVRPFQPGDRLRRIHWPVSARTGQLHVTSTYADEDARVVVVVDAIRDLGQSGGIDATRSSMDITIRAGAAIAEHFLRRGDRVELRVFGAWHVSRVPAASGLHQLRKILDTLSLIRHGTARGEKPWTGHPGLGEGTLVVMLSPLVDPTTTDQAAVLIRAGITVVAIDTLPDDAAVATDDECSALAWRLRMLERRLEIRRLAVLGVPVVQWGGPQSLDRVLRDLSRRRPVPRMTIR